MLKRIVVTFLLFFSIILFGQENCNNSIDDDGDGKIDLNDTDCICNNPLLSSLLPNHSFETYSFCPDNFSELDLATPWNQATNGTTDYYNTCNFIMPAIMNSGLQNFPNGNGIVGAFYRESWKEYLGLQLSSPLIAGTNYQLTFQIASLTSNSNGHSTPYNINIFEPVNITMFGNPNNTTFPLNTLLSPNIIDSNWIDIGNVKYIPSSNWNEITMTFTPNTNINSIMIGAPIVLPVSYDDPELQIGEVYSYFLYDNLILNKSSDFKINIHSTGNLCSNDLVLHSNLTSNLPTNTTYQWYKNNIAINNANNPTYSIPFNLSNIGTYCVKVTTGNDCFISNRLNIQNNIPSPNIIATQPSCINLNGSINVSTLAAEYSFNGGTIWQTSPNSGPLPPSRYFIKIKTASGCVSESIAIDLLPAQLLPPPTYSTIQPSCPNQQGTGISITIESQGSLFSFDDGLTWTTNNTANNLLANSNYYIRYKDLNGCMSNRAQVYLYTQYIPYPPNVTISQPTNCLNNFGTITVTTNAILYSFDNGLTWNTSPISPPLPQGTYYVKVKLSNNSCSSLAKTVVINPPLNAPAPPTFNISQPLSCTSPFGIITITSLAFQYSFDNGFTYTSNPNSGLLAIGTYLIKVKNSSNCESSSISVTINAPTDYPSAPLFTINQPDCYSTNGSISITSLASEYSFDNGVTWSTNPTLTNLPAASYHLKIKNTLGCISSGAIGIIIPFIDITSLPNLISPQTFCIQQNATINSILITGQNIKWYDSPTNGNVLPITTALVNGTTYYASQAINGCESNRIPVLVQIQNTPTPTGNANQSFCTSQNATVSDIVTNGTNVIWYNSATNTTPLANTTLLTNNTTYYATQTINGCESVNRLAVTISLINTLNATNYSETICDDLNNSTEKINLSDYNSNLIASTGNTVKYYLDYNEALLNSNQQINNFSNFNLTLGTTIFYVRIDSPNTCFQIVTLTLELVSKPIIPINDIEPLCEGKEIIINAGNNYDSYTWSTGETSQSITITQGGNYSVTVTENHGTTICSSTKNFTVVTSNIANIQEVINTDWTDQNNTITVLLNSSSQGNYEYSINGSDFQDSNTFTNLEIGEYTVYVRDKNGCGMVSEAVYLLTYPKFFTPNGDGFNDYWKIKFSEKEANLLVKVFDRYGKFLKQFGTNSIGWDGKYLGKDMPSTDYWFVVTRANGKEYKGHFSLKR